MINEEELASIIEEASSESQNEGDGTVSKESSDNKTKESEEQKGDENEKDEDIKTKNEDSTGDKKEEGNFDVYSVLPTPEGEFKSEKERMEAALELYRKKQLEKEPVQLQAMRKAIENGVDDQKYVQNEQTIKTLDNLNVAELPEQSLEQVYGFLAGEKDSATSKAVIKSWAEKGNIEERFTELIDKAKNKLKAENDNMVKLAKKADEEVLEKTKEKEEKPVTEVLNTKKEVLGNKLTDEMKDILSEYFTIDKSTKQSKLQKALKDPNTLIDIAYALEKNLFKDLELNRSKNTDKTKEESKDKEEKDDVADQIADMVNQQGLFNS